MPAFTFMAYTTIFRRTAVVSRAEWCLPQTHTKCLSASHGHLRPVLTKASLMKPRSAAAHCTGHAQLRQYIHR